MPIIDSFITWMHLLTTSIWVGGSIFIGLVIGPLLKTMTDSMQERITLMIRIGRKFNRIALPALAVLVATGLYNAHPFITSPDALLSSTYGMILAVKIALVASMIVVFGLHIKISGSKAENELAKMHNPTDSVRIERMRTKMIWLGRVIVGQSVAILLLVALLDSGI